MTDSDPISPIVQSQPVITKSVPSNVQVHTVTDSNPVPPITQSQPVISKSGTIQKWEKYKNKLNARRREKDQQSWGWRFMGC